MTSKIDSSDVKYTQSLTNMRCNAEVRNSSRPYQTLRTEKEKIQSTPKSQSLRPQGVRRKTANEEELVKYMSNLPGYLQGMEKGENLQEKALNFGVLDWRHLEKWKYTKKQVPGSPSHQRNSSPSHSSYLNSSLKEGHSNNTFSEKQQLPREAHSNCRNYSDIIKLEKGRKEDLDPKMAIKMETSSSKLKGYEVLFGAKEKMKARVVESNKRVDSFRELSSHCSNRIEPGVLLFPKDRPRKNCSILFQRSESTSLDNRRLKDHYSEIYSDDVPHSCPLPLNPSNYSAKSGPVRLEDSASSDNSNRDAENATKRTRSSPLRRLLDPLLKPKAENRFHSPKPIKEESTSTRRACKSANGRMGSSTVQPVNQNLDFSSRGSLKSDGSHQNDKCMASTVQALLQFTEKGLPWFTFAVDNESDILAASMKKIASNEKDDGSSIYTFHSVHEIKKKSGGWISPRSKGQPRGYLSNIVGQMKVSRSFTVKEFVLCGVELRQADQGVIDFKPSSEVAAIVVKIPSDEDKKFTVILPSGVHGLPSNGVPSPLIERWKSGGSCDCGGWDVGCRLRVLGNRLDQSETCLAPDRFDLFIQGGGDEERRPIFSLAPFKNGIYSVSFSTSISKLQAFSICIAVLNSKAEIGLSNLSNWCDTKTSEGPLPVENDEIKAPNGVKREVPVRYIPYPPLSPVGRV